MSSLTTSRVHSAAALAALGRIPRGAGWSRPSAPVPSGDEAVVPACGRLALVPHGRGSAAGLFLVPLRRRGSLTQGLLRLRREAAGVGEFHDLYRLKLISCSDLFCLFSNNRFQKDFFINFDIRDKVRIFLNNNYRIFLTWIFSLVGVFKDIHFITMLYMEYDLLK